MRESPELDALRTLIATKIPLEPHEEHQVVSIVLQATCRVHTAGCLTVSLNQYLRELNLTSA